MDAERRHFVLRRLHSLSGIVPVGLFMVEHFYTNAWAIKGADKFNEKVVALNSLPYLYVIEILGIGLPILFHAALGVYIAFEGSSHPRAYPHVRNWFYMLQRATGMFLVVFIGVHVYTTRFSGTPPDQLFEHMASYLVNPWMFLFYTLGVLTVSFHFGNGIWGFLVSWGITTTPSSQRAMTWVCMGIFLVMSFAGINSLFGFLEMPIGFLNR